ncbi:MAG TPA: hypothetical protein VGD37_02045 [Kofleriaceae bacterium]
MADDDRAVMERLAALEAEVKADADAQRARKAAAIAKLRDQRVTSAAHDEPPPRRRVAPITDEPGEIDHLENLGGALELASKANRVKQELQRRPGKGDKSWIKSGVASLALGPVGWLYAGSMREAVPATVAWVALAALASKLLPVFLMMPVLMVVLPLSAIAGVVYALQYNRAGARQRLFTGDKAKDKPKQLRRGRDPL